jgi:type VI secretion system protein VasD
MAKCNREHWMARPFWLGVSLGIALLPGLMGCAGKPPKDEPPPPAPMLKIDVAATATVNSTASVGSLPIVVRVYELRSAGAFRGADFFSLYDQEAAVLGDDLIASEEMTLAPGQQHQISKPLNSEAQYIGVIAAYRDIDRAQWREVVPLVGDGDHTVIVSVDAAAVDVAAR